MRSLIVIALLFVPAIAVAQPDAARKACTDAMNNDPAFAEDILKRAYEIEGAKCEVVDAAGAKRRLALDAAQHDTAAKAIAKNEKHVIMAYVALWLIAAGFVIFLWRRQMLLKTEIAQLRADLDAATKDGK